MREAPYLGCMSNVSQAVSSRRRLLELAAAGAAVLLAPSCSRNEATGRPQLVMVDESQLADMASSTWADLKRRTPIVTEGAAPGRLARIGADVASAANLSGLDWEFVVFDSPEVNAFVLPGGKVGFNTGLLERTKSDHEVAAILGHEVGHVVARHASERVSQHTAAQLGVQAMTLLLAGELGSRADEVAGMFGVGLVYGVILPYSRAHELEADRLGVRLMAEAGYDPRAAENFWKRMIDLDRDRPQRLALLSTHPADDARLSALRVEIERFSTPEARQDVARSTL